jgi:hypothetical protein
MAPFVRKGPSGAILMPRGRAKLDILLGLEFC